MATKNEDDRSVAFLDHIVVDPRILVGKPVIKGTRMPVSKILNLVAHGMTFDEIVSDFPVLTKEDIQAALLYAGARMDHEEVFALTARG